MSAGMCFCNSVHGRLCGFCQELYDREVGLGVTAIIVRWLRAPNEDGTPCSVEREILAQRLEKGEHLR